MSRNAAAYEAKGRRVWSYAFSPQMFSAQEGESGLEIIALSVQGSCQPPRPGILFP